MKVRHLLSVVAAAGIALQAASALAQSQPIRMVFPFSPGGTGDALARLLADKMGTELGQTILVDNRTGGAGRIGVSAVKNAAPDGLTFLLTPFGAMTIYPIVYKSIDYDPFTDLQPLGQVATFDLGIAVGPDVPVKTPEDLVAWLKANPAKAQFGTPGAGSFPHFFGLMLGRAAGVEMAHLPYRGTAPALTDLLAGQIPIVSSTVSDLIELHKAGRIHLVATSDVTRSEQVPDVPTFKERGFDISGIGWYGLYLPARTPASIVARLNKALVDVMKMPDVKARLFVLGFKPTGSSPEELAKIQRETTDTWTPIVKASGFVAD